MPIYRRRLINGRIVFVGDDGFAFSADVEPTRAVLDYCEQVPYAAGKSHDFVIRIEL